MKFVGLVGRGFLIWLVPFVVSFFLYTPDRELAVSYALFKSIMVVVLTAVTIAVNWVKPSTTFAPWLVALVYTAINLLLDIVIVIPTAQLTLPTYVEQIGLVYTLIPAITWALLTARTTPRTTLVAS
jgi:hypothetical protein